MPSPVFVAEASGSRVYKIGKAGDTGTADAGGNYTAVLKTEKFSPAGNTGLCYFRRVDVRVWHTGSYTITMKVYVDGVQTQIFDSSGTLIDQEISFTVAAPTSSPAETASEASITAQGTYIEVQLTIVSNNVTGVFLPEELQIHFMPVRQSKERSNAEAT